MGPWLHGVEKPRHIARRRFLEIKVFWPPYPRGSHFPQPATFSMGPEKPIPGLQRHGTAGLLTQSGDATFPQGLGTGR